MKARYAGGVTYLLVIVCLLLMRISSSLGVYAALGADPDAMFTCVVQILCFGALPLVGWFAFAHGMRIDKMPALADDFSLKKPSLRNLLLTLALAIPAVAVTSAVSTAWTRVLYVIGYDFPFSDPVAQTAAELFSELALVAVLPALFEEFTHRGLLLAAYGDRGERAALVSALLFALMHQNILQFAHTFVLGLILACIVYCTGSVFPAMFVHFFNNFISVVSGYDGVVPAFGVIGTVRGWLYGSVAGVVVLIILAAVSVAVIFLLLRAMRFDAVREGRLPSAPFFRSAAGAIPLSRDILLLGTVAVGVAATLFSLVWGYL